MFLEVLPHIFLRETVIISLFLAQAISDSGRLVGLSCFWWIGNLCSLPRLYHHLSTWHMAFFFFLLFQPHTWNMKVPEPVIVSELKWWPTTQPCNLRSFNPLCLTRDGTCASGVTWATAVGFLTHCTTVGTLNYFSFTYIFFVCLFWGLHPCHMEVPRLGF